MEELPKEISYTPVPYIALVGLNATNNINHTLIWNTFAINRSADRPSLYYKLISDDCKFLPSKIKKSYERYTPYGILKTNWLAKHLFEIPSVVVIFEEANWESLQQTEVKVKCIARIKSIRDFLTGRQTKVVLILLQSSSIAMTDDSPFKDSASKLCTDCDINPKSLFIIPINEQQLITGFILRIEFAIFELSKIYYVNEAKSVKFHKDQLNKSSQIFLFIRLEFKLGFFNEVRQIYNTALGHYKNAYVTLMEIRITTANIFEIKSIASLLNYKICRLCFYLNVPMDAISHFRKHIDIFQNKFISDQIEFEHYNWLSKQFYMFAELFEMAINSFGLTPSLGQHPGIYYFEAAMHIRERRKSANSFIHLKTQLSPEEINSLNLILAQQSKVEFIGHFPWQFDSQDGQSETYKLGYKALQYNEQLVDHTTLLINLYINVLNQIKKFKKPRFMRYLMFLIGQEYYNLSNYSEALTYLCNILPFYRDEKWDMLYFSILQFSMNSAYLSNDISNFIKFAFELMATKILPNEKIELMECISLMLQLQFKPLKSFENFDENFNEYIKVKYCEIMSKLIDKESIIEVPINMDNGAIYCKIAFSFAEYFIGDRIKITALLFSNLPEDVQISSFQIKFKNSFYDLTMPNTKSQFLKCNALNEYSFEIRPLLEDMGKELHLTEFGIQIGTKILVLFNWYFPKKYIFKQSHLRIETNNKDQFKYFNDFQEQTYTKILDHESKLNLEINCNSNIFVNEFANFKLKLQSNESYSVTNVQLSLKITTPDSQADSNFKWFYIKNSLLNQIDDNYVIIDELEPQQCHVSDLVIQMLTLGDKLFTFNVSYDLLFENNQKTQFIFVNKCINRKIISIEPFSVSSTICNVGSINDANIRVSEPFKLKINLFSTFPEDIIEIDSVIPKFSDNVCHLPQDENKIFPFILGNVLSLDFLLSCPNESAFDSLGSYVVHWTRKQNSTDIIPRGLYLTETTFQLPSTSVLQSLVFVELQLPQTNYARSPFMAKYIIHNRMDVDMPIEISMGLSDCFMISGNKLIKSIVPVKLFIEQTYIFFPLLWGELSLPQFGITALLPGQNPINIDYVNQMIPNSIKVLPQQLRTC